MGSATGSAGVSCKLFSMLLIVLMVNKTGDCLSAELWNLLNERILKSTRLNI